MKTKELRKCLQKATWKLNNNVSLNFFVNGSSEPIHFVLRLGYCICRPIYFHLFIYALYILIPKITSINIYFWEQKLIFMTPRKIILYELYFMEWNFKYTVCCSLDRLDLQSSVIKHYNYLKNNFVKALELMFYKKTFSVILQKAQMVACLPLIQQDRGSISGGVVHFHLKIFNRGARRGGDVNFLIARLYITGLD